MGKKMGFLCPDYPKSIHFLMFPILQQTWDELALKILIREAQTTEGWG